MVYSKTVFKILTLAIFIMQQDPAEANSYITIQNEELSKKDFNLIYTSLNKANKEFGDFSPVEEVVFTARNAKDNLIGVLVGYQFYGSFMVDILFISEQYRRQGIGSDLLREAEEYALSNKLSFMSVNTMSFWNAIPFYEKNGFVLMSSHAGYEHRSSMHHLRKPLH